MPTQLLKFEACNAYSNFKSNACKSIQILKYERCNVYLTLKT